MSTRANIVLLFGSSKVYIYRHHDGYVAGLGADLARKMQAAGDSASALLQSLLAETYEKQSYETKPTHVYELTTDIHGDIEYLYVVRFEDHWHSGRASPATVGYTSRRPDDPDLNIKGVHLGSLERFVEIVNTEIRYQNARLAQLRASQPAVYGDVADDPYVDAAVGVAA